MARRRRVVATQPNAVSPAPFIGMGAMAGSFFLIGASVLLAPWWVVALLLVAWLVLFVTCCRWWTPHPRRLPWVAVGSIALWAVVVLGGASLGLDPVY